MAVQQVFTGSMPEETAYHEAGHIVVAAVLGLDLKPRGITVYQVPPNVSDGLACYWDHPSDWDKNLQAALAGQFAQYENSRSLTSLEASLTTTTSPT